MAREERFTFMVNREERQLIAAVADRLDRTQSDALRWLVKGAAEELGVAPEPEPVPAAKGGQHGQR